MVVWICLFVFAFCYVLTPPIIALAWRIGAVDVPCDWRRMHPESIPRAGGLCIYASFFMGCVLFGQPSVFLVCALGGGALLLTVGLADDIFCLGAWTKLLFQIIAATATVLGSGLFRGLGAAAAIVWVIALTNAHNFIDGLDGLFAGCSAIEGGLLGAALLLSGLPSTAAAVFFLAVACFAFRLYNRYPAQIFAGDCGSGTVGFLLGVFSLPLFHGFSMAFSSLAPFFLFAYPLTDLFTAVTRRLMRGKSPFAADRAHLHHRITAVGLTHVQCGEVLLLITAALGVIGVLLVTEGFMLAAALACLVAAFLMIRIRRYIMNFA